MKDLPKVFANRIEKNISNNKDVSYDRLNNKFSTIKSGDVKSKIDKLFGDRNTVYSIDCIVTLENAKEKHTIIGKTDYNLVTRTQKLIPIKDIIDIELA